MRQATQTAPTAPAAVPPPLPTPVLTPGQVIVGGTSLAGPADIYQGLRAQREELGEQFSELNNRRQSLAEQLEDPMTVGASRTGLEQRITEVDARISSLDKQIADADAQVARAAAVPGATVRPPEPPRTGPPEEVWPLSALFMLIVFLPLSISYARRVWRRSAAAGVVVASFPREMAERFARMEQAVDATALEVERIGEGQRFMTRVLTETNASRPREIASPASEHQEPAGQPKAIRT
ncbi:MAG: hypothetical protein ABIR58_08660 [Gemmatimonadaceae bacterium]